MAAPQVHTAAAPASHDWYATAYRKLFFDFHSQSTAVGLASAFDAEKWARRVEEANAQAVSVFTKCGRGWSFYRKGRVRYVHPQLPAGLDMLEEQIRTLHRRGIRAMGYYHVFGSEPLVRDRPGWVQRNAAGEASPTAICKLGPVVEEHWMPHLEEIVSNYEVDAMFFDGDYAGACYCDHCRQRFRQIAGADIPKSNADPVWNRFVAWNLEEHRRVRQRIAETIHKVRPGLPILHNWVYAIRHPELVPDHVGGMMGDIQPDDQGFNGSYHARWWAPLRGAHQRA